MRKGFRPDLRHRPVIVLSNNDGCVVAHSSEAKQLGIKMCQPFFEIEDLYFRENVSVFSSNYELYANLSGRMTLRKEGSYAQVVGIVLNTNSFRTQAYPCIGLEYPISDTRALIRYALKLLDKYYRSGYLYKRAGVYVEEVIPEKNTTGDLFAEAENARQNALCGLIDKINDQYSKQTLNFASSSFKKKNWGMKRGRLSSGYTTCWTDLPRIEALRSELRHRAY